MYIDSVLLNPLPILSKLSQIPPMFYITDINEYGHLDIVETFDNVADAESALELLELALQDDGPTYRLRCAIAELKEQLEDHLETV